MDIFEKISKLKSVQKHEIYLERRFEETSAGNVLTNIEELMSHDKTVLLKGDAGAGKSSLAAKIVQHWEMF